MDGDLKRAMSGMWAELDTDPSSELTKAAIPGLFRWMNFLDLRVPTALSLIKVSSEVVYLGRNSTPVICNHWTIWVFPCYSCIRFCDLKSASHGKYISANQLYIAVLPIHLGGRGRHSERANNSYSNIFAAPSSHLLHLLPSLPTHMPFALPSWLIMCHRSHHALYCICSQN